MLGEFRAAEAKFEEIQKQYGEKLISADQFKTKIKNLQLKDHLGRVWSIGGRSSDWYLFENSKWIKKDPNTIFLSSQSELKKLKEKLFKNLSLKNRYLKLIPSTAFLIGMNLIPILGILFFGWRVEILVFLYWIENAFVGILNIYKTKKAEGPFPSDIKNADSTDKQKSPIKKKASNLMGFIYFMFVSVHGLFVILFFGFPYNSPVEVIIAISLLVSPHLFSLFYHFIYHKEYKRISYQECLMAPISRMMILHLVIFSYGFYVMEYQSKSITPIIIMVILKTILDVWKHMTSHLRFYPGGIKLENKAVSVSPKNIFRIPLIIISLLITGFIAVLFLSSNISIILVIVVTMILMTSSIIIFKQFLKKQKYNKHVRFELTSGCGFVNSWLSGIICLKCLKNDLQWIMLKLECIGHKMIYRESEYEISVSSAQKTIWKKNKKIPEGLLEHSGTLKIPVEFWLHEQLPPTIIGRNMANIKWTLSIKIIENVDMDSEKENEYIFDDLPIFKLNC